MADNRQTNLPASQGRSDPAGATAHPDAVLVTASYEGPIPPAMLAEYERIVPGSAERWITMAESQHAHRIQLESKVVDNDIRQSQAGLAVAALMGTLSLVVAIVLAWKGSSGASAAVVASVIALFGAGYGVALHQRRGERAERWAQRPVASKKASKSGR